MAEPEESSPTARKRAGALPRIRVQVSQHIHRAHDVWPEEHRPEFLDKTGVIRLVELVYPAHSNGNPPMAGIHCTMVQSFTRLRDARQLAMSKQHCRSFIISVDHASPLRERRKELDAAFARVQLQGALEVWWDKDDDGSCQHVSRERRLRDSS